MNFVITVFALVLLVQPADSERARLVAENGANASFKGDVLDLRSGRGWLRTPRVFLDFRMEFEFKSITPEIDAAVVIRTWTGKGQWPERGLRVNLPTQAQLHGSPLLVGHNEKVNILQQGSVPLRPADQWQRMQIEGEGKRIRISVNDASTAVFEVERFGGHILFENRRGRVEIRNITLQAVNPLPIPPDVMQFERLQQAGGITPKLLREVSPVYTREALQRGVQGVVQLQAAVLADGSVGGVRVSRGLDPMLDLSAMAALKGWRFVPGTLNNEPVAVIVHVEMTFKFK